MSMDRDPNVYDREAQVYDRDSGGSNTLAYVIGGLVVALGLLAFLFYDGGSRDVSTTSSVGTQTERPAAPMPPAVTNPAPTPASPPESPPKP